MRPFSLEQAKQGKKVVTRDGREFMFGAHNPNASKMERLVGWIGVGGGQLVVSSCLSIFDAFGLCAPYINSLPSLVTTFFPCFACSRLNGFISVPPILI